MPVPSGPPPASSTVSGRPGSPAPVTKKARGDDKVTAELRQEQSQRRAAGRWGKRPSEAASELESGLPPDRSTVGKAAEEAEEAAMSIMQCHRHLQWPMKEI